MVTTASRESPWPSRETEIVDVALEATYLARGKVLWDRGKLLQLSGYMGALQPRAAIHSTMRVKGSQDSQVKQSFMQLLTRFYQ